MNAIWNNKKKTILKLVFILSRYKFTYHEAVLQGIKITSNAKRRIDGKHPFEIELPAFDFVRF
jgi:hypothetical protein